MDFTEEPLQLPKETKIESNNSSNQDLGDLSKRNNSGIIQTNPTRRLTDPTLSTSSKDDVEPVRRQSDSFPNITASSTTVKHDLYSHFSNRLDLLNSHQLGSSNPIWRQVLSSSRMNTPTNSKEALDFDNCFQPVCETLAKTNHKHGNFSSLLLFLLTQLRFTRNMAFEHDFSLEAYNAIILVRVSAKYMVDNLNRLQLHEQFEMDRIIPPKMTSPKIHHDAKFDLDPQVIDDKKLRAELLLEELFHIIIHADTRSNYSNYEFYMEAIKLLLILFSTQTQKLALVSNKPGTNYFLDIVFNRLQHLSPHIVLRLMQNFNEQLPTPANGGIISNAYSYLFTTISTALTTLSRNGLLLLSILVHQSTLAKNNFRTVLASIVDSSNTDANKVKVKFKVLHDLIAYNLHVPEACILLYLMVTQNPGFKNYLLSRTDLDLLILPILKIINDISIDSDFNQIYVLTTVLLIISQDDFYMEQTHKVTVNAPIWYIDRVIKTTSVGGLIILILLKTISINLSSLNDLFLHELLLATLTNFSSKINGFHPQSFSVANKFIVLLETATKKMVKLDKEDVEFDIYQDVVYEILQVFNNVITRSVQKNPQLVYALLHKKELFDTFNSFPKLTVFSSNIQVIVKLFNDWILEQEIETSDDVLDFIRDISRVTFEGLVHVDAVKFGFQEEDGYHLFFLPFVWSIGFSI